MVWSRKIWKKRLLILLGIGLGLYLVVSGWCHFFPPAELPACELSGRDSFQFYVEGDTFHATLTHGLYPPPEGPPFPIARGPLERDDFKKIANSIAEITGHQEYIKFLVFFNAPKEKNQVHRTLDWASLDAVGAVYEREEGYAIRLLEISPSGIQSLDHDPVYLSNLQAETVRDQFEQVFTQVGDAAYAHYFLGRVPDQSLCRCLGLRWRSLKD